MFALPEKLNLILQKLAQEFGKEGVTIFCRHESLRGYKKRLENFLTSGALPHELYELFVSRDEIFTINFFLGIEEKEQSFDPAAGYKFLDSHCGKPRLFVFPYFSLQQNLMKSRGYFTVPKLQLTLEFKRESKFKVEINNFSYSSSLEPLYGLATEIGEIIEVFLDKSSTPPKAEYNEIMEKFFTKSDAESRAAIASIQDEMLAGNCYLLNYTLRVMGCLPEKEFNAANFLAVWLQSRTRFGVFFLQDQDGIMAFSPERFLAKQKGWVLCEPIKGTIKAKQTFPYFSDAEILWSNEKEILEQTMVTDLIRHDLNSVCTPGSVQVFSPFFCRIAGSILQMQSFIFGELANETTLGQILKNTLPAGSITGTPKYKVTQLIDTFESTARGFYTGIFGVADANNNFDSTILIRSFFKEGKNIYAGVGGGITVLSSIEDEITEQKIKFSSFYSLFTPQGQTKPASKTMQNSEYSLLKADNLVSEARKNEIQATKKVIFIDHMDSFSNNLLAALQENSLDVTVMQAKNLPDDDLELKHLLAQYKGVVLSPGPGHPLDYPASMKLYSSVQNHIPILGVCLGFQIALATDGAQILKLKTSPRHGQQFTLLKKVRSKILLDYNYEGAFVLYNSLGCLATDAIFSKENWNCIISYKEFCMVAEHQHYPRILVQFHPESFASPNGKMLIKKWAQKITSVS